MIKECHTIEKHSNSNGNKRRGQMWAMAVVISLALLLCSCQRAGSVFPDGYTVDSSLYLAEGDGIYVFIENNAIDYGMIGKEICSGNAKAIKEQYEDAGDPEEDLAGYAAIQNILGITEIYLGDYERAYKYFNDTISLVQLKELPGKEQLLAVLYNNAGAVIINRSKLAAEDKQLEAAAQLCEDPYLELVIAVNRSSRTKEYTSKKIQRQAIAESKELIEIEKQAEGSPGFVSFMAARYLAAAYTNMGEYTWAIEIMDEYIPIVPDMEEYNLLRAALLGTRGYAYHKLGEYSEAIGNFQEGVLIAEKTVDENSQQVALQYARMAISYVRLKDWEQALICNEKAIPGYEQTPLERKGLTYYNMGYICHQLKDERAKEYLIKSYIVMEELGKEHTDMAEGTLYEIYEAEGNTTLYFYQWLEKELQQLE